MGREEKVSAKAFFLIGLPHSKLTLYIEDEIFEYLYTVLYILSPSSKWTTHFILYTIQSKWELLGECLPHKVK